MKPAPVVMPPIPKLVAACAQEFEGGPPFLVIKGFSSEEAVAEFCLKLAAMGIVSVAPVADESAGQGALN